MKYVGYRTNAPPRWSPWRTKKHYQIRGWIVRKLVQFADWFSPDVYIDYIGGPHDGETGTWWAAAVCGLNGTIREHSSVYQLISETEAHYVGELVYLEKNDG